VWVFRKAQWKGELGLIVLMLTARFPLPLCLPLSLSLFRCEESSKGDGSLQIMYGLHGEHKLEELELDHLEGYMNSKPVRIGNGAYDQVQLDIYGELLDTVYLSNKYAEPISYEVSTIDHDVGREGRAKGREREGQIDSVSSLCVSLPSLLCSPLSAPSYLYSP
jgi:hypothetical protein